MPSEFSKLSCWLIGNGAWGKNIRRTLEELQVGHLRIGGTSQPPDVDAVFIATPVGTHAELALPLIGAGLPVFVEKPLCATRGEGLAMVQAWWGSPRAPVLCDFQHLFSSGFEGVMAEFRERKPHRISFVATLGGPGPVRTDCHPVWDYGVHLVAMALQLGMKSALANAHLLFDAKKKIWTIAGDPASPHQLELNISNQLPDKVRQASIAFDADIVGNYHEPSWLVHRENGDIHRYDNLKDPPLENSIRAFLRQAALHGTVLGPKQDSRFGLSLPMDVDAMLRRLVPLK